MTIQACGSPTRFLRSLRASCKAHASQPPGGASRSAPPCLPSTIGCTDRSRALGSLGMAIFPFRQPVGVDAAIPLTQAFDVFARIAFVQDPTMVEDKARALAIAKVLCRQGQRVPPDRFRLPLGHTPKIAACLARRHACQRGWISN